MARNAQNKFLHFLIVNKYKSKYEKIYMLLNLCFICTYIKIKFYNICIKSVQEDHALSFHVIL